MKTISKTTSQGICLTVLHAVVTPCLLFDDFFLFFGVLGRAFSKSMGPWHPSENTLFFCTNATRKKKYFFCTNATGKIFFLDFCHMGGGGGGGGGGRASKSDQNWPHEQSDPVTARTRPNWSNAEGKGSMQHGERKKVAYRAVQDCKPPMT